MKKVLTIAILLIISSLQPQMTPKTPYLKGEYGAKGYSESDRPAANFILDIIQNKNAETEDMAIYAATGAGLSVIENNSGSIDELNWINSRIGYGGASGIALDNGNNIWMTTATDTFLVDENVFLPMGTGVHFSPDSGRTWTSFRQPGLTPIQGLAYDIACDTLGGVWMACWGQSLQRSLDAGQTWKTLTCDNKEWDPFNNDNHKMFAVHFTLSDHLWVGTAEGINLCTEYNVPDEDREWKQFTYYSGLTGHFTTAIGSYTDPIDSLEYVFAATWTTEKPAGQVQGVSYTFNNGQTWNHALAGEKIYNFGFSDGDVYACAESGLWKSSDNGGYWEKYVISAWSERKRGYIDIETVYSFEYRNDIMFVGTGNGMVVSDNNGNDWYVIEAYMPASDSKRKTYAYPNPFSPLKFGEVKLQFNLSRSSAVSCSVFNYAMEKVRSIAESKPYGAGEKYIVWDGKDDYGKTVANGVYYYVISSEERDAWNKILVFE